MQTQSSIHTHNVLISEPYIEGSGLPILPYLWGLLKTYWEHHGDYIEEVHWLSPVFQTRVRQEPSFYITPIDVLGLSCFTWNWKFQCLLAQQVKKRYPHCIVVAGGPEPDYKDPDFFKKYPYIDIVVLKDGEMTFTKILNKLVASKTSPRDGVSLDIFYDIPGLYLPNPTGEGHVYTGIPEIPKEFPYSPYLEQHDYYEKLLAAMSKGAIAIMETTRGCPYKCDFCDWGSATRSKIRKLTLERIEAEVEWFAKMKIVLIYSTDANFGILPQDIEIAQMLADVKKKTGFPKYFHYSNAKNNPPGTYEIVKVLYDANLIANYKLSIQHTSPEVLKATSRHNISTDKLMEVVNRLRTDNVPISVELILGLPADTPDLWRNCLADLMEWGLHIDYFVFPYSLLPNAPAAEKAYLEKWEVETVDRYIEYGHYGKGISQAKNKNKACFIVKTKTYTREDWVDMNVYTSFIMAFHCRGLTRYIALYLRFSHQVEYKAFYEGLYQEFFMQHPLTRAWAQAIKNHYEELLVNDQAEDFMDIAQLPKFSYKSEAPHWLFIQSCFQLDELFSAIEAYCSKKYFDIANLESLVAYQQHLMVLPDYDRKYGKLFETNLDWVTYFEQLPLVPNEESFAEPIIQHLTIKAFDQSYITVTGQEYFLEWGNGSEETKWEQWIQKMVFIRNVGEINNFRSLEKVKKREVLISKP